MSDTQWWVITGFMTFQCVFNAITFLRQNNMMRDWQALRTRAPASDARPGGEGQ